MDTARIISAAFGVVLTIALFLTVNHAQRTPQAPAAVTVAHLAR